MNSTQTLATLTEIADVLRHARHMLIICHVAPDGDAIGTLLGLGWLLRDLPFPGKFDSSGAEKRAVTLACADKVPSQFAFLPGAAEIISDPPHQAWDAVITVDASDTQRLGSPFRPDEYEDTPVINLDHHVTNLYFGTLNYVDPKAAATAQIIVDLADALHAPISLEVAVCLLTGLVTDTLGFRTSNVTARVMGTAMQLMEAGANLADITERTLNHKPLNMIRLWGLALADLRLAGQVVWSHITQAMRSRVDASKSGDAGLVSFLLNAQEAKISAVFSEKTDGQVEIGFRARPGYDVSQVALSLGGGGHPQASGCTIPGPLAAAEARVIPLLVAAQKTAD